MMDDTPTRPSPTLEIGDKSIVGGMEAKQVTEQTNAESLEAGESSLSSWLSSSWMQAAKEKVKFR